MQSAPLSIKGRIEVRIYCAVFGEGSHQASAFEVGAVERFSGYDRTIRVRWQVARGWQSTQITPDHLRYLTATVEKRGKDDVVSRELIYDSRGDVPCDMERWALTRDQLRARSQRALGCEGPPPAGVAYLPLGLVRTDGGTQPRAAIDEEVAEEYRSTLEEGGRVKLPPVIVFFDGTDCWLADGFHRHRAHQLAKREHILADVRHGALRDAVLFSAGANTTHGLRRSNADKRRAVETLLRDEEWAKWSDGEIARRCGVSQPFVGSVRDSLKTVMSQPAVRVGADGRKTDVSKIGKRRKAEPAEKPEPKRVTEESPAPPPPKPFVRYPHSRLMANWLNHVESFRLRTDLERAGLDAMLAEPDKWDREVVLRFLLPALEEIRDLLIDYERKVRDAFPDA